ncbi:MAG: thioredoxin-dependent thiol peroxidase [Gemmatimonadaceae bacterium]
MALSIGATAPDFDLEGTDGPVSLRDLRGSRVVLYFYPKDDTPGCTREACSFRDSMQRLSGHGAVVVGVSKDSIESHNRFREKYGLAFPLASDPDNKVATEYGAFGPKSVYGKEVMGTIRSTFLIDAKGKIEQVWSPVKVDGHVDQVLEALAESK